MAGNGKAWKKGLLEKFNQTQAFEIQVTEEEAQKSATNDGKEERKDEQTHIPADNSLQEDQCVTSDSEDLNLDNPEPILDLEDLCQKLQNKYDGEWKSKARKDKDISTIRASIMKSALAAGIDKSLIDKQLAKINYNTLVDVPRLLDFKNIPELGKDSSSINKPSAARKHSSFVPRIIQRKK